LEHPKTAGPQQPQLPIDALSAYDIMYSSFQLGCSTLFERILSIHYWLDSLGTVRTPLSVTAYLLAAGLNAALFTVLMYNTFKRHQPHPMAIFIGLGLLSGSVLTLNRVTGWWPYARWHTGLPALVAACGAAATHFRREAGAVRGHWSAFWNWRLPKGSLSWPVNVTIACISLVCLLLLTRYLGWPLWTAPALLAGMLVPGLFLAERRRQAFMPACAILPACLLGLIESTVRFGWQTTWLSVTVLRLSLLFGAAHAELYQVTIIQRPGTRQLTLISGGVIIISALIAWAAWCYLSLAAAGVSGVDPYGYLQMASDWMRYGTFLHRFPLAADMQQLGLNPEAALHIGYRMPVNAASQAASVWPAGHSWLLGTAARIAGEQLLYLSTPVLALLGILASGILAFILFPVRPWSRWLLALITSLLTATSFEYVSWTLVHMADISAALFSAACIALAWLARRPGRKSFALAGIAGFLLGMAYWIRHTQVVLMLPLLVIMLAPGDGTLHRRRLVRAAVLAGAALLTSVPDLLYHRDTFGSLWIPESKELAEYSLAAIPRSTWLLISQWGSRREFLLLSPWMLVGFILLMRRYPLEAAVVAAYLGTLWLAQAPYAALRLRDLLSALPVLSLVTAFGITSCVAALWRWRRWVSVLTVFLMVMLFYVRSAQVLHLPATRGFNNFGYLWFSQRTEFERLEHVLPVNAIVGATLHAGAVEMYSGHLSFQVDQWTVEQLHLFITYETGLGRPVFLLDDSTASSAVINGLASRTRLVPFELMEQLPYYYPGGGSDNLDMVLYQVMQ